MTAPNAYIPKWLFNEIRSDYQYALGMATDRIWKDHCDTRLGQLGNVLVTVTDEFAESESETECYDEDGCPRENAVLQRQWRWMKKQLEEKETARAIALVDGKPIYRNREIVWDKRKPYWNMFVIAAIYDFWGRVVLISPDGRKLLLKHAILKQPGR